MTWTRLDDVFVHDPVWDQVDFAGRWHYLCLVQFCSRTHRYNGLVPLYYAEGCSDLGRADAETAHQRLGLAGLIECDDETVRVVRIDDYLPPPHLRDPSRRAASTSSTRAWRQRKCDAGDHSKDCPRLSCPEKLERERDRDQVRDQSRQDGTETGQAPTETTDHVGELPDGDDFDSDFLLRRA